MGFVPPKPIKNDLEFEENLDIIETENKSYIQMLFYMFGLTIGIMLIVLGILFFSNCAEKRWTTDPEPREYFKTNDNVLLIDRALIGVKIKEDEKDE